MSRNVIFSWRPDVCVCVRVCVCVYVSDFQRLKPRQLINGLRYRYEIWYASEVITTL